MIGKILLKAFKEETQKKQAIFMAAISMFA